MGKGQSRVGYRKRCHSTASHRFPTGCQISIVIKTPSLTNSVRSTTFTIVFFNTSDNLHCHDSMANATAAARRLGTIVGSIVAPVQSRQNPLNRSLLLLLGRAQRSSICEIHYSSTSIVRLRHNPS